MKIMKFFFGLVFFFLFFSFAFAMIPGCCERTLNGELCAFTTASNCPGDSQFVPGAECGKVLFCQKGCCYDEEEGIFEPNVLKTVCNADWASDPNCNLPGAALGCCVLGDTTRFETRGQCRVHTENFALSPDYEVDWREGLNELECIKLTGKIRRGACVLENRDCNFGSEAECFSYGGDFHENLLCTASMLETACEKTEKTRCVSGKDQVYFVDSCGNTANIYDSRRADDSDYWRRVYEPEESCSEPNGARNSKSCGNCNRFEGGICAPAKPDNFEPEIGDYYCKDTTCEFIDFWGQKHLYRSGESWCVYESPISDGDDAPGSRHFRYICNSGVVQVEPCADYRNEICIQQDTLRTEAAGVTGSIEFSNAYCRKNNAKHCILIGEQSMEACRDEPDCMVRSVTRAGGSFDFDICVPMFPEGFSFEPQYQATGAQVCSINTRTCVVTYVPVLFGCMCVDNCGCLGGGHFGQMDEICKALGDCEGKTRILNWYRVNPVRGQFARYDSRIEKYMAAAGLGSDDYLGVGSSLFEQSAFSGFLFATRLDSDRRDYDTSGGGNGAALGAMFAAIGALLTTLSSILSSTMMMIAGVAMSLFGALAGLLGGGTCPPTFIDYHCDLWQPPVGAADCAACNADKDIPCTEYKCKTLGTGCDFINPGTDEELCVPGRDDGSFPVINYFHSIDEIIESHNLYEHPELLDYIQDSVYTFIGDNHLRITNINGGCLDAYAPIVFSFNTHIPSQCKFDTEQKSFEEMEYYLGNSAYKYNHSTFFMLPDPSHGQSQGIDISSEMEIYIKCRSRFGHMMPNYLKIEMCVHEGPDETPPRIVKTTPKSGSYVSYDADGFNFVVETNEPATCRWDYQDKSYNEMENSFECDYLVCSDFLLLNESEENVYYVRCKDQPWLIDRDDEHKRNANVQSFEYVFYRPEKKITIDSVKPTGELVTTSDKLTVDLEVKTSGGAQNHTCSWSFSGYETMIDFFETGSPGIHLQSGLNLIPRNYDVYINCFDETNDYARAKEFFRVFKKTGSPLISRVWQTGNNLNIITTEQANCVYSNSNCFYAFDSGEGLSGDGINHRISVIKGRTYYIKCEDSLRNRPPGCSIILNAV